MVYAVLQNWSVLQEVIDAPEYKLLKSNAKPTSRALLKKVESIICDPNKRAAGTAAVAVMRPISPGLHYLEGDHVGASHILPVYALLHQSAQSPCDDVNDTFSQETINAIASLFKGRCWNGTGRKVGIRNDLHCLAWKLDLHARYIVTHGVSNGPELLTAIDSSFGFSAVMEAIKTYRKTAPNMLNLLLSTRRTLPKPVSGS